MKSYCKRGTIIITNRYYTASKRDSILLNQTVIAMNQMAILYMHYYFDFQKANQYLLIAEDIAKNVHLRERLVNINSNLANLYLIQNSMTANGEVNDLTFQQLRKAYFSAVKEHYWNGVISATFNYAVLGDDNGNFAQQVGKDLDIFLSLQIPDSIKGQHFVRHFCLAIKAMGNKKYDEALKWLDQSYEEITDRNKVTEIIYQNNILNVKHYLLMHMERYKEALEILVQVENVAKKRADHPTLYVAYLQMSQYYNSIGDSVKAETYELRYLREKNYVMETNKLQEAGKAEFLFQINKMNEEMKSLYYERRIHRLVIGAVAVVILLVVLVLFLLYRKYRQTAVNNRRLYQKNLELLAADEERRRLLLEYEEQLQNIPLEEKTQQKYQTHQVDEQKQSDLLHRILYVMETSTEIYADTFSLRRLAELVGVAQTNYVSQAINDHYQRSFPTLLNEYRIREACRRMNDREHYGHLTNEAVAQSVGFRSYPNFVSNFKKFTGLTPSAYQKQAK